MDLEVLLERYRQKAQSVTNPYLQKLLSSILEDEKLAGKLKLAPGGKLWHHSYVGGLLEHTLKVVEFCEKASELYELVDRDLLVAGALIHDIGKIYSYSLSGFIDYTDEGRLLGHIVSGDELVSQKIAAIEGFPESLALELRHLVLSHQGELEFASPVVPQTLEAIILYYADEIDAKAGAFTQIIQREKSPGKKWSDWVPLIHRYIYLGEETADKLPGADEAASSPSARKQEST